MVCISFRYKLWKKTELSTMIVSDNKDYTQYTSTKILWLYRRVSNRILLMLLMLRSRLWWLAAFLWSISKEVVIKIEIISGWCFHKLGTCISTTIRILAPNSLQKLCMILKICLFLLMEAIIQENVMHRCMFLLNSNWRITDKIFYIFSQINLYFSMMEYIQLDNMLLISRQMSKSLAHSIFHQ